MNFAGTFHSVVRCAGRGAAAGVLLLVVACLAPGAPALAAPVPWLYDVDVAVEGRTATARLAASGEALDEVLSRVSGLAHVPRNAGVTEALGRPEAYYNRFVFLDNGKLRIHFTPAAILELMDRARLPVWSANRPRAMLWLVVEAGGVRRIVDGQHPLAAPLAERARQRGLNLQLPLMDLEDRRRVRPAVVRGRLYTPLEEASKRYGAEVTLAGQVLERACVPESLFAEVPQACGQEQEYFYSGSLQAWMGGDEFAAAFAVVDPAGAARATVDFLADELAGRFAVLARPPNPVRLTIVGIESPVGYARLLGYLGELEFVSSVDVAAVEVGRLEVTLHTRAGLEQLVELFESEGRIRPDPANAAVLIWRGP